MANNTGDRLIRILATNIITGGYGSSYISAIRNAIANDVDEDASTDEDTSTNEDTSVDVIRLDIVKLLQQVIDLPSELSGLILSYLPCYMSVIDTLNKFNDIDKLVLSYDIYGRDEIYKLSSDCSCNKLKDKILPDMLIEKYYKESYITIFVDYIQFHNFDFIESNIVDDLHYINMLLYSCLKNYEKIVSYLIKIVNSLNKEFLTMFFQIPNLSLLIISTGNYGILKILIENGLNINNQLGYSTSPKHTEAYIGLKIAIVYGYYDMVKLLLDLNIDFKHDNYEILYTVFLNGYTDITLLFIEKINTQWILSKYTEITTSNDCNQDINRDINQDGINIIQDLTQDLTQDLNQDLNQDETVNIIDKVMKIMFRKKLINIKSVNLPHLSYCLSNFEYYDYTIRNGDFIVFKKILQFLPKQYINKLLTKLSNCVYNDIFEFGLSLLKKANINRHYTKKLLFEMFTNIVKNGHIEMVSILLKHIEEIKYPFDEINSFNIKPIYNVYDHTILSTCASHAYESIFDILIDKCATVDKLALHNAALVGQINIVDKLLNKFDYSKEHLWLCHKTAVKSKFSATTKKIKTHIKNKFNPEI